MEQFSVAHKALQVFCADFWPSAEDCSLILGDIGIESARINLGEPSIMRWLSIINELRRRDDGSLGRLVVVLMDQYPENQALRAVCAPWIPANPAKTTQDKPDVPVAPVPAGAVLVKKFTPEPKAAVEPKVVPLVAPADFADDAELVVPKIDTLWDAVVDMEQRYVELEKRINELEAPRRPLSPRRKP